jgi:hypothetical protein
MGTSVREDEAGGEDDEGKMRTRKESEESEVDGSRGKSTVEGEPQIRAGRRPFVVRWGEEGQLPVGGVRLGKFLSGGVTPLHVWYRL